MAFNGAQGVANPALFGFANKVTVEIDLSSATWNTAATHEVFTVTGLVVAMVVYRTTETLTSGGAATIAFGLEGLTSEYAAAQTYANLTAGTFVGPGATTTSRLGFDVAFRQGGAGATKAVSIIEGLDIGYVIASAAVTNGTIEATCYWTPISANGLVVAGTGAAL